MQIRKLATHFLNVIHIARQDGPLRAWEYTISHQGWRRVGQSLRESLHRLRPPLRNPFEAACAPAISIPSVRTVGIGCARDGNFFMREIALLLGAGFEELGIEVRHFDADNVHVARNCELVVIVAPHEFFELSAGHALLRSLSKNPALVMLNTEQPHTSWFALCLPYLRRATAIWDMNYQSAVLLRSNGLNASFLPLGFAPGYTPRIDPTRPLKRTAPLLSLPADICAPCSNYADRPIDILFVGTISPRRADFFARHAEFFAQHHCVIYLPAGTEPFQEGQERTLDFEQMAALAARSKITLNIHRDEHRYLEWQRIVTLGLLCGTLVISETCDSSPAVAPGQDFIEAPLERLPELCATWLQTPDAAQAFADRAREDLCQRHLLSQTLALHIGLRGRS